ncbi:MAG: hypothetical protein LBD79_09350 [Treponema sp.]|nr:hypothetical protein [Treponema sp.]
MAALLLAIGLLLTGCPTDSGGGPAVTTLAGSGDTGDDNGGYADGSLSAAKFANPRGVAVDSAGKVYVAEFTNQRIRKITQ